MRSCPLKFHVQANWYAGLSCVSKLNTVKLGGTAVSRAATVAAALTPLFYD
jgi:hypothetical protein